MDWQQPKRVWRPASQITLQAPLKLELSGADFVKNLTPERAAIRCQSSKGETLNVKRLKWVVEYDEAADCLEVHLYRRVGGFLETAPWRRYKSDYLHDYSRRYNIKDAQKHVRAVKEDILKKLVNNTSIQQLIAVVAAESGPVTAQELKEAADALEREKLETAG